LIKDYGLTASDLNSVAELLAPIEELFLMCPTHHNDGFHPSDRIDDPIDVRLTTAWSVDNYRLVRAINSGARIFMFKDGQSAKNQSPFASGVIIGYAPAEEKGKKTIYFKLDTITVPNKGINWTGQNPVKWVKR